MIAPTHPQPLPVLRWLLLAAVGFVGCVTGASAADPTPEQQFWLELINRMRRDPGAELERLTNYAAPGVWGSPKSDDADVAAALNFYGVDAAALASQWSTLTAAPPLAWSNALNQSAGTYSNVMVNADEQAHGLDGLNLEQRITNGGYTNNWLELGEALFAKAASPLHGHAAMAIDWGPGPDGLQSPATHREAVMDPLFKEVGIGFQSGAIPGGNVDVTGPLVVTEHFASQFRQTAGNFYADAILTGVVYEDTIAADLFYTPGEGWSGVPVIVYNDVTDAQVASGVTNSAGGYNIPLAGLTEGVVYRVEAPDSGLPGQTFSLNSQTVDYGVPVTVYDNAYVSFQAVPEPGSAILLGIAAALVWTRRSRSASIFV